MMAADLPAALELWRVTEGMGLGESDKLARLAAFLERNPGLSAVAELGDGALVGAVMCGEDGRRGYLHHLAVARANRRQGIAQAMVAHCFAGLAAREIEKCTIFLLADNTEGERFWQRACWVRRDNLKVMQKNVVGRATSSGGCTC